MSEQFSNDEESDDVAPPSDISASGSSVSVSDSRPTNADSPPYKIASAEKFNYFMACSLCGVPGYGRSCSAHTGTESQTYDEQRSKQVRVASMTSKDVLDKLYSTPYCKETIED